MLIVVPEVLNSDEIRTNVLETLKQGIEHGLYVFGPATSGWDAETPLENIRYVYSLVREYASSATGQIVD